MQKRGDKVNQGYRRNKALRRILICIDSALEENGEKTTVQQKRITADQMVR